MTDVALRDGTCAGNARIPFAPFQRMQTFPTRKKVPHAVDSPRPPGPYTKKGKHVSWKENLKPDEKVQTTKLSPTEDSSAKKRHARKASSKGKLQWLFDQDRVYWESPHTRARRSATPSSSPCSSSLANSPIPKMQTFGEEPAKKSTHISPGKAPWVPVEQLSDSVNIGDDELLNFASSTDEESCNLDLEMSHLEMNAPEIQVFITTQQAPRHTSPGTVRSSQKLKGMSGFVSREERPGRKGKEEGWRKQAAVLKAKCEVLRMEKGLARRRWKEGCIEMAQAAEMAHSLRAAVESILEPVKKRGTVSEPCTPRRENAKDHLGEGLAERLHKLKASSELRTRNMDTGAQMDLGNQAKALQERIEMLQQRSQFPSSDSSTPEDSDYGGELSNQRRTRCRNSSSSNLPLQTIEEETKNASNYRSLGSIPASANDAVYQLLKQAEDGCILEEEQAKEMQTKETVRKILSQIQAEAEQWKQAQEVLKHVSTEMVTLQKACLGWEKRALAAETLAATWQREGDEWRVKAQIAQQKIKELEAQLTQLQETIEGVKQRHALEQNRWLDIGSGLGVSNNLGYTLVLQPIPNISNSDGCNLCGDSSRTNKQEVESRDSLKVCNLDKCQQIASRRPSPCQSAPQQHCEPSKVREKCHTPSLHLAPVIELTKGQKPASLKNDKEGSVSLERSRTRVPGRRASPARSESVVDANQENICGNSTAPKKVGISRGLSPVRKSGQSPTPGCRGPSPSGSSFSAHPQRAPLKDLRVNIPLRH